ncbi:hypothetical protein VZT92_023492 [Zoarces viviparus]|uniref:Uncharacterized protein n=1 Tax=Zoarces viviparus TaxID=48416 RepID=A0AAW1E6E0_ZOAVI
MKIAGPVLSEAVGHGEDQRVEPGRTGPEGMGGPGRTGGRGGKSRGTQESRKQQLACTPEGARATVQGSSSRVAIAEAVPEQASQ